MTPALANVDDNADSRGGTISAFNGIEPVIETFADHDREAVPAGEWLADCIAEGVPPDECARRAQKNGELKRAGSAVKVVIAAAVELIDKIETRAWAVSRSGTTR
jgi:hypothetical protein